MSTNPADCDRTTVYTGECRNFADSEWIRFDSGRRRSPDARDGNTWLIDVAHGSFWMADDKVRNLVPLVPTPTGGQWTRDDLPDHDVIRDVDDMHGNGMRSRVIDLALDTVVGHLNANHPKPDAQADAEWLDRALNTPDEQLVALDEARIEANIQRNRAVRERDAAASRAEQAERVLRERDEQEDDATRAACERAEQAERERDEAWYERDRNAERSAQLLAERDEWKARAEQSERAADHLRKILKTQQGRVADAEKGHPAPAVSRADIEKAIRAATHYIERHPDEGGFVLTRQDRAVDAVCDLLGIEAETAVDPAEAAEARTDPAVTKADIEQAIRGEDLFERQIDAVWSLVSGDDPAVFVVRESDLPEVTRTYDGWTDGTRHGWEGTSETAMECVETHLEWARFYLAASRAIEAGQATDPLLDKAQEFAALADWELTDREAELLHKVAAHVLGQEADQ